jgi:hypothetical protein
MRWAVLVAGALLVSACQGGDGRAGGDGSRTTAATEFASEIRIVAPDPDDVLELSPTV